MNKVTAITDARATYESESATNDKTYLNAIVIAESTYSKVVANKSHEFRTGAITAEQRDSAIATAWATYQTAAKGLRNTYRRDQAADAADYRTAIAEAEKTLVTAVTTAKETLTNTIEDSQATLNQQRWDEWLTASKSLVNLEANSAINKGTSLATAINQLAGGGVSSSQTTGDGTTLPATTITSFWVALGEKAQMSTDRITKVKNAERAYYGSTAWTEVVNGVTVNHSNGTRGTLDARRDFEVSVSQATATLNKATMQAAGERDRSIATAAWNLAQSRNTYETSWAALDLDSSGWSLGDSSLVMMGFGGTSTATTTSTTTVTTTGSGTDTTSNTSTGVSPSVSSGASYFTRLFTETGATQDGPNNPPSSGSQIPGTQTDPQTNPAPPTVPVAAGQNDGGDEAPGYSPASTNRSGLGVFATWFAGLYAPISEDPPEGLPVKNQTPGELISDRDTLTTEIAELEGRLNRVIPRYDSALAEQIKAGLTTHQAQQLNYMQQMSDAIRRMRDELSDLQKQQKSIIVILQTEHPQVLAAEEQRKLLETAMERLKNHRFTIAEFDEKYGNAAVYRDDGQMLIRDGDDWLVFKYHPLEVIGGPSFSSSYPAINSNYVQRIEPAYWMLSGRLSGSMSFQAVQEMQQIVRDLGIQNSWMMLTEFGLHVLPFGTLADKAMTGEGGDWDAVLITTAGDVLTVASFGLGGASAAARIGQARIAAAGVGVNLFGAAYEGWKAGTDEEGLTGARAGNIFAGLLFAMLDAKELRRLQDLRLAASLRVGSAKNTANKAIFDHDTTPLRGYYDVKGHGNGYQIATADSTPLGAEQLAALLRIAPDYKQGTPIRLLVCWAGYPEKGLAQQLATLMDTQVLAATSEVLFGDAGRIYLTLFNKFPYLKSVRWRLFFPDGSIKDLPRNLE